MDTEQIYSEKPIIESDVDRIGNHICAELNNDLKARYPLTLNGIADEIYPLPEPYTAEDVQRFVDRVKSKYPLCAETVLPETYVFFLDRTRFGKD